MGNYGIKIAKVGKSITSSDRADYVFWSKYHSRTILISGSTTIYCPDATATTLTLTHNLGYKPMFDFYVQYYDPSSGVKQTTYKKTTISDGLAGGFNLYTAYVDNTNLYLYVDVYIADLQALSYKYYIYYDPIP